MTTINTRNIKNRIIDRVKINVVVSGRKDLNEITNINTASPSFDFLNDEPELHSAKNNG